MLVGVAAPESGEGATTVAIALAQRLARHGHDVLLVDANTAQPLITRRYDLAERPGLAEVLRGAAYEEIDIGSDPDAGFDVLPVGRAGSDEALLQLPACSHLAHRMRGSYDYTLIDLPPILASADVRASAGWLDALLLVVARPPRRRALLHETVASMGRARERLIGVVVNRTIR